MHEIFYPFNFHIIPCTNCQTVLHCSNVKNELCIFSVFQIVCGSDAVANGQVQIPSLKIFDNIRLVSQDYRLRMHPHEQEPGPEKTSFTAPSPDPMLRPGMTRVEADIKRMQQVRYNDLKKRRQLESYLRNFNQAFGNEKRLLGKLSSVRVKIIYPF